MRSICAPIQAAFTLVEMLVVIAIMSLLVTVTIVSLPALIESVNYAAASTRVMGALGAAQTAATASRRSTGVAFLFDTQSQTFTVLPLQLDNRRASLTAFPTGPVKHSFAQSFNPLDGVAPVELPAGTGVFGLAFNHIDPNEIKNTPQRTRIDTETENWYAGEIFEFDVGGSERDVNPWIFPRNDPRLFFDPEASDPVDELAFADPWDPQVWSTERVRMLRAVRHANSFFIQFAADGSVATSFSQGDNNDPPSAYIEWPDLPINPDFTPSVSQPDPIPFDDEAVFDPEFRGRPAIPTGARAPNPEVILRSVSQLAIVDLKRMSDETGVGQPWLIHPSTSLAPWPNRRVQLSTGEFVDDPTDERWDVDVLKLSRWIDLNAEIIAFNRYTGQAMRR